MTKNIVITLLVVICVITMFYAQYQRVLEHRADLEASAQRSLAEECSATNQKLNKRLEKALAETERNRIIAEKASEGLKKTR